MQRSILQATELTAWLTRTTQVIDRSLRDRARASAVAALLSGMSETRAPLSVLAQVALLDDCLRVATLAIDADGVIDREELSHIAELVHLAAGKYFTILPRYESFDDGASNALDVDRFLELYRSDPGPFGHASDTRWRGVALVQTVERITHNGSPLRDHEHMLARIMDVVFDGRATAVEAEARRQLREQFEPPTSEGPDPRAMAFCRPDGPEIFSSVAHGSQIHVRDPFDVESIHAEARAVFHRQVERAVTPAQHVVGHGRTLLILGESGSGKTHLLRALRYQLHSQRRGYAGYLQMSTEVSDYARYVLRNFIDSIERPYDAPTLSESGLLYLSNGLAEGNVEHPRAELEALRSGADLGGEDLNALVGGMVDRILRTEGLQTLEPNLLHALLLLQRRDAAIQRRVIQFLRCESLTAHEQRLLGGLAPRLQSEDPMRTLKQLGAIAFELQLAAIVLLVDQVEDTLPDTGNVERLQQAIDVLRNLTDAIPSAVVVISCLDDVYTTIQPRLSQSVRDRIEREPAPIRLAHQRQRGEVEEMLVRRLDHLYSTFDVAWREDEPVYPFVAQQIEAVTHFRTRDCLAEMYRFHQACIATGKIVEPLSGSAPTGDHRLDEAAMEKLDQLWNDAVVSTDTQPEERDSDDGLLDLIEEALRDAATELDLAITVNRARRDLTPQMRVTVPGLPGRVVEVCDRVPQGGHLAAQLVGLTQLAHSGVVPVALRRSDFEFGARSVTNRRVGDLINAGGVPVVVTERELRAIVAARKLLAANLPKFAIWKSQVKPISQLALVRAILGLEPTGASSRRQQTLSGLNDPRLARSPAEVSAAPWARSWAEQMTAMRESAARKTSDKPGVVVHASIDLASGKAPDIEVDPGSDAMPAAVEAPDVEHDERAQAGNSPVVASAAKRVQRAGTSDDRDTTPASPAGPGPAVPAAAPSTEPAQPANVRLGVTATMRAEPISLALEQIKTHVAFVGSPGSGKTTAALAMIERLLEQGVSALLIDRKGDLARYASEEWWAADDSPPAVRARRQALRAGIEIALYTPGNAMGRPLRLPLVPPMFDASAQDRDQLSTFAASGLAAMMGYNRSTSNGHKQSVLKRAIELNADQPEITLEMIHDCVSFPDPELLSSVGALKRFFAPLAEDLQSLLIQRGALLAGSGEALDLATLLPAPETKRTRLTIINTAALGEGAMLLFWVSRLLIELDRLAAKRPRPQLQAVAFFDEADLYLPAVGQPATKDPMFSLLRRARARGLGILLATQSPGDFDYKARENILTWLVGKVTQDRAVEKMRNLLADYPNVSTRLANQPMGHFFMLGGLSGRGAAEIKTDRSLMETKALSETEIIALARSLVDAD
jgi:adenylylsulfate kinase-like enzyme